MLNRHKDLRQPMSMQPVQLAIHLNLIRQKNTDPRTKIPSNLSEIAEPNEYRRTKKYLRIPKMTHLWHQKYLYLILRGERKQNRT